MFARALERSARRAASSPSCHAALRVSCAAPITEGRARFASEASASAQPTERAEPDGLGSFRARLASGPGFGDFIAGAELPGAAYALAAPTSLRDKSTRKPPWMKLSLIHI